MSPVNLAFFGGTFDPVHRGHIAVAESATKHFELDRVLFVPAELPPHKQDHVL
ncbi:MAG: nicotinic acid mononucleotide adenylyltransferase, partial [Acidobacteria bacterium]